jgi:hypothetical protein
VVRVRVCSCKRERVHVLVCAHAKGAPDAIRAGERRFGGREFECRRIIAREPHLGSHVLACYVTIICVIV